MLHSQEECEIERLERESATHSQMGGFDSARWAGGPAETSSSRMKQQGCLVGLILAVIPATITLLL